MTDQSYWSVANEALKRIESGNPAAAVKMLTDLIAVRPDGDVAHFRLAGALDALGDNNGALRHYRKAVELHPASGVYHHGYMRALARTRLPDVALSAYGGAEGLGRLPRDLRSFFATPLIEAGADPTDVGHRRLFVNDVATILIGEEELCVVVRHG